MLISVSIYTSDSGYLVAIRSSDHVSCHIGAPARSRFAVRAASQHAYFYKPNLHVRMYL